MIFNRCNLLLILCALVTAEKCRTPNGEEADCISLYSCPVLITALATQDNGSIEFVRQSRCNENARDPMVCCGSSSNFTKTEQTQKAVNLLADERYCGYQQVDGYFRNDTSIAISEFPWIAALLYKNKNATNEIPTSLCAGSLLNNRYVLTGAHCFVLTQPMELVGVRLGEFKTDQQEDCVEEQVGLVECSSYEDYGIEKFFAHPSYSYLKKRNDIGLIRLNRKVTYTDYIRPICLPTPKTNLPKVNDTLYASGWGVDIKDGKPKKLKKKVSYILLSVEECQTKYYHERRGLITEDHLCTLGISNSTDITCSGDGGAPIMFFSRKHQWFQDGIASFGSGCGRSIPDVHTKVINYMDWIGQNIEP